MSEHAAASTWDEVLDDYAATVASLEHRLDGDTWAHPVQAFEPPVPPTAPVTPAQQQRFAELHRRAEACNARMERELAEIRADVANLDTRLHAAREYHEH